MAWPLANQIHLIRWIDYSDRGMTSGLRIHAKSSTTPPHFPFGPQAITVPDQSPAGIKNGVMEYALTTTKTTTTYDYYHIRSTPCRLRSIAYSRQDERCDFCAASAAWGIQDKGEEPTLEAQPLAPESSFVGAEVSWLPVSRWRLGWARNGPGARYESAVKREAEDEEGKPLADGFQVDLRVRGGSVDRS